MIKIVKQAKVANIHVEPEMELKSVRAGPVVNNITAMLSKIFSTIVVMCNTIQSIQIRNLRRKRNSLRVMP